jgi:hypothetical protein
MESMNIKSTEERYAGEGQAGTDPLAKPTKGRGRNRNANPALEVPDASIAGLTTTPKPDASSLTGQQDAMSDGQTGSSENSQSTGGVMQQAEQKADVGIQKSAEGLKKAAGLARSATEDRSGPVGTVGTQAAEVLDKGATYLEKGDTEQFIQDLEALVRRRPVESLLVAAAAGFIVSKAMR